MLFEWNSARILYREVLGKSKCKIINFKCKTSQNHSCSRYTKSQIWHSKWYFVSLIINRKVNFISSVIPMKTGIQWVLSRCRNRQIEWICKTNLYRDLLWTSKLFSIQFSSFYYENHSNWRFSNIFKKHPKT